MCQYYLKFDISEKIAIMMRFGKAPLNDVELVGKHIYTKIFVFINQLTSIKWPILTQRSSDFIILNIIYLFFLFSLFLYLLLAPMC